VYLSEKYSSVSILASFGHYFKAIQQMLYAAVIFVMFS